MATLDPEGFVLVMDDMNLSITEEGHTPQACGLLICFANPRPCSRDLLGHCPATTAGAGTLASKVSFFSSPSSAVFTVMESTDTSLRLRPTRRGGPID